VRFLLMPITLCVMVSSAQAASPEEMISQLESRQVELPSAPGLGENSRATAFSAGCTVSRRTDE
jgi:hypothetical protein